MKRLVAVGMMACAVTTLAMPTKVELTKAQPIVNELMKPLVDDFKAKRKSAKEVAESAESFAKEAETEAAKLLLLRGAISYYSRSADYEKAADAVALLQSEVKDIPPETVAEIISRATSRISAKNAPRLYSQYRLAKALVKAKKDMPRLEASLKKRPLNFAARREYAELLALTGDWKGALAQFAELKGKEASMAKAELAGKAKQGELGDFWWDYKAQSEDVADAIKAQAVAYYRAGLAANEITGLKKALAEQRIEEAEQTTVAAAHTASSLGALANGNEGIKTGGKSPFVIKGNKAMLTFPNGHVMEFIKCPAGKFNMVYDNKNYKKTSVELTRPFWISKTHLTRGEYGAIFPEVERLNNKNIKVNDRAWTGAETIEKDGLFERLATDFQKNLSCGYVIRFPSLAEYYYAYHANTTDRNDPYYHNNNENISKANRNKMTAWGKCPGETLPNKWGICDMLGWCNILDRFDIDNIEENCRIVKPISGKDPFYWKDTDDYVSVAPHAYSYGRWDVATGKVAGVHCHLVIGPDLVSEWRAKNKKK